MTGKSIIDYALKNYTKMFREPDGLIKHKYIVPGSVYSSCLWDWDSWITNIALKQFVKDDIGEYEKGCIYNFLEIMDKDGRIPIFITPSYTYPDISKCKESNIHKPCLAQHAAFIIKNDNGNAQWLSKDFPKLKKFVDCYINNFRHQNGLYYWYDDTAIGVDNDPSTFYRPNKSSASIYLNCLMYKELEALCYIGNLLGEDMSYYTHEAENLKHSVRNNCYDEKDGMYYSVDLNLLPIVPTKHKGSPRHWDCLIQRLGCWSGFMAMWCGIATPEQAERMVKENLLDENAFWAPYGVRTLSKYEKMYTIKASGNPSCWLGPIWGISNYMVFKGLVKYGYEEKARELAEKTIKMFSDDIDACGEMHEYYNPETGAPVINPGFQNWNLLSVNMSAWLDGEKIIEEF
jgi:putative isomerase